MQKFPAKKLALLGLLFALAVALSYVESLVPNAGIPGIKLGLSNIVTMFCLFFLGPAQAFVIAGLKSAFVLLLRGPVAAMLSAAGGIASVGVMALLRRPRASVLLTSVTGAITHNSAQLAVAWLFMRIPAAFYYLPVLVLSGVAMGAVTAAVYKLLTPAFEKIMR